jgi:hypothetical protein
VNAQSDSTWDMIPGVRVGPLRFGQPRSEVRSILGAPNRVFKKVPFADNTTDAYTELGLHVFYDPDDRLESVDAFAPAPIRFDGIQLVGVPAEAIAEAMAERGYGRGSYDFPEACFSLYVVDEIAESANIFRKGADDITDPNSQRSRARRAAETWRRERESRRERL